MISDPVSALSRFQRTGVSGRADARDEMGMVHRLWFRDGLPVWVETSDDVAPLCDELLRQEAIGLRELSELRAEAGGERALALLVSKRDAPTKAIEKALRTVIEERIAYLCQLRMITVEVAAHDVVDLPAPLSAVELFLIAARVPANLALVDSYISRLGSMKLALDDGKCLAHAELDVNEERVASALLSEPVTVLQLLRSGASARAIHSVVFALSIAGALGGGAAKPIPGSNPPPPDGRALANKAQRLMSRLAYAEALIAVDKALAIEPANAAWRAMRAFIRASLPGNGPASELATLEAITMASPHLAAGFYYQARLLVKLKRSDDARRAFAAVVELDPSNLHAREELARLRAAQVTTKPKSTWHRWLSAARRVTIR